MTRTGCLILAFIVLVVGGVWWLAKRSGPVVEGPVAQAPAPSVAPTTPTPPGNLVIAVSGVQKAQLTETWGDARGDGTREHHAIDIMAPTGTPVVAAAAGTVEKIFESENGGHTIYVRRADPAWIDYYAHLDAYAPGLTEGQKVGQGQLIGTVGSSGDASADGPHLHYEIKHMAAGEKWHQGTEVDPYPILTR